MVGFVSGIVLTSDYGLRVFGDRPGDYGQALGFISIALFVVLSILLFVRQETFLSWRKFAKYYLPVATLMIIFAPDGHGGGFGLLYGQDSESTSMFAAILFLIISLLIIIVKTIALRRRDKQISH